MPVMDEFKKEREDMKNQPLSKRMAYFWEYYKWWVIAGVAIVIAIILTVRSIATRKNEVLYVALINSVATVENNVNEDIIYPFLEAHDIGTKKNTINFSTDFVMSLDKGKDSAEGMLSSASSAASPSAIYGGNTNQLLTSQQKLSVYIASGQTDMLFASDAWTNEYAYNGIYAPVDTYFTEEEIAKYSDFLYYIDDAVLERYDAARSNMEFEYEEEYPDCDDISSMEKPVAIGFKLENCEIFTNNYVCGEGDAKHTVLGVVINSPKADLSKDLITYILDNTLASAD